MPLRDTFFRTLHDQGRPVAIYAVAVAALTSIYMLLYPSFGEASGFQAMIDEMPEAFRQLFITEGADLSTPAGFLNIELFSFVGPLMLVAYTIGAGGSASAGEEERGTIDLLMSLPVKRAVVLTQKTAAIAIYTIVIAVAMWLGLAIGAVIVAVELDLVAVGLAITSLALMAFAFGAFALLLGALTGRRMVSMGITAVLVLVAYMLNAMAPMVDWLEPLRPASPFYLYIGNDPLNNGVNLFHAAALLVLTVVAAAGAVFAFERRDLAT